MMESLQRWSLHSEAAMVTSSSTVFTFMWTRPHRIDSLQFCLEVSSDPLAVFICASTFGFDSQLVESIVQLDDAHIQFGGVFSVLFPFTFFKSVIAF